MLILIDDDWVENDIIYDPTLDEIYGPYFKNHLIKIITLETPIKDFSMG